MPKLGKDQAKQVGEAESAEFAPLEEGMYLGKLEDVEERDGPKGDYWSWRFSDLVYLDGDDGPAPAPGSLWVNTSLSEAAAWKLKEVFDAFGVKPNTDTDTLLGQEVKLVVTQRVIERGARMGEIGNNVDRVLSPADDDDE